MYYKLAFKYFLVFILAITTLVFALIWFSDPLQVFHKSFVNPDYYMTYQMREADLGIINYADYDSAIVGTSMIANMSSKEASDNIGGKFINLSMFGSTFYERKLILNKLLKKKQVKTVIYSLDPYFKDAREEKGNTGRYPLSNFDFLYDDEYLDNFKIYFNSKYFTYLLAPFVDLGEKYRFTNNLDRPKAWCVEQRYYKRFNGFENWIKDKSTDSKTILKEVEKGYLATLKKRPVKPPVLNFDKTIKYIDECITSFVKAYPQTEFHIVIPPYSKLSRAISLQKNKYSLDETEKVVTYLVKKSEEFHNMKIYGFDNESFTFNIDNYKDLGHYKPTMDSYMIGAITAKSNILTSDNVQQYYDILREDSLEYDLKPYYEAIKKAQED